MSDPLIIVKSKIKTKAETFDWSNCRYVSTSCCEITEDQGKGHFNCQMCFCKGRQMSECTVHQLTENDGQIAKGSCFRQAMHEAWVCRQDDFRRKCQVWLNYDVFAWDIYNQIHQTWLKLAVYLCTAPYAECKRMISNIWWNQWYSLCSCRAVMVHQQGREKVSNKTGLMWLLFVLVPGQIFLPYSDNS
jgi:hypothetical protein